MMQTKRGIFKAEAEEKTKYGNESKQLNMKETGGNLNVEELGAMQGLNIQARNDFFPPERRAST